MQADRAGPRMGQRREDGSPKGRNQAKQGCGLRQPSPIGARPASGIPAGVTNQGFQFTGLIDCSLSEVSRCWGGADVHRLDR